MDRICLWKEANNMKPFESRLLVRLCFVVGAVALIASACGSDDDAPSSTPNETQSVSATTSPAAPPTADPSSVSGEVVISGSSTVEPISVLVAELFRDVAPDVRVNIDGPGTGDGFKLFCAGDTDISNASRQIQDSEKETCAEAGIDWIELRVAIDGIAVMTNANNTAIDCVNFEDLYALVGPESQNINNWADANDLAAELGSASNLPDASLDIHGPGEESGTFDSFVELVLEHIADERGQDATTRPDYSANADDNLILQGIQADQGSLGWVGFAFAANAKDVKLLEVESGDGCVSATPDTIASGQYPISRSLYIYVNANEAASNPAIQAYVDYYVQSGMDIAVSEVGYVDLTEEAKTQIRANWSNRVIG